MGRFATVKDRVVGIANGSTCGVTPVTNKLMGIGGVADGTNKLMGVAGVADGLPILTQGIRRNCEISVTNGKSHLRPLGSCCWKRIASKGVAGETRVFVGACIDMRASAGVSRLVSPWKPGFPLHAQELPAHEQFISYVSFLMWVHARTYPYVNTGRASANGGPTRGTKYSSLDPD